MSKLKLFNPIVILDNIDYDVIYYMIVKLFLLYPDNGLEHITFVTESKQKSNYIHKVISDILKKKNNQIHRLKSKQKKCIIF